MSGGALDRRTAETLLALTARMNAAAAASDWDEVARGDVERRSLLDRGPLPEALDEAVPTALAQALRDADGELLARAREARAALGERSRHRRNERDVCRTYADIMRSVGASG